MNNYLKTYSWIAILIALPSLVRGADTFFRGKLNYDINIYQKAPFSGYTTGIEVGWKWNDKWGAHSGIGITKRRYNFDYEFDPIPPPPKTLVSELDRPYNVEYDVRQLTLPVIIDYYWLTRDKLEGYLGLGVSLMFNLSEKAWGEEYRFDSNGSVDPGPYSYNFNYDIYNDSWSPNYIGFLLQGGLIHYLNPKVSINTTLSLELPSNISRISVGYSMTFSTGIGLTYLI